MLAKNKKLIFCIMFFIVSISSLCFLPRNPQDLLSENRSKICLAISLWSYLASVILGGLVLEEKED